MSIRRTPPLKECRPELKKATCPFIGIAVATAELPVRNCITQPLSSIDDVVQLVNSGGGDLGEVLKVFAEGNHARMFDGS